MTARRATVLAALETAVATLCIISSAKPRRIWKASSSIPDYRAQAAEKLFVLELVAVRPPGTLAQILNLWVIRRSAFP